MIIKSTFNKKKILILWSVLMLIFITSIIFIQQNNKRVEKVKLIRENIKEKLKNNDILAAEQLFEEINKIAPKKTINNLKNIIEETKSTYISDNIFLINQCLSLESYDFYSCDKYLSNIKYFIDKGKYKGLYSKLNLSNKIYNETKDNNFANVNNLLPQVKNYFDNDSYNKIIYFVKENLNIQVNLIKNQIIKHNFINKDESLEKIKNMVNQSDYDIFRENINFEEHKFKLSAIQNLKDNYINKNNFSNDRLFFTQISKYTEGDILKDIVKEYNSKKTKYIKTTLFKINDLVNKNKFKNAIDEINTVENILNTNELSKIKKNMLIKKNTYINNTIGNIEKLLLEENWNDSNDLLETISDLIPNEKYSFLRRKIDDINPNEFELNARNSVRYIEKYGDNTLNDDYERDNDNVVVEIYKNQQKDKYGDWKDTDSLVIINE